MACETDFDCPTTLICYSAENAASWYYEHYGANAPNSTCDCATWYGWTGDDCTELSWVTYIHVALQMITALIALVWALAGIHVLWRLFRVDRDSNFFSAGNITAMYSTLALLFMLAWRLINIVMFLRPDLYDLRLVDETDKLTQLTVPDRTITAATATFTTLCALNVSLMWLQVANQSKRLRKEVAYFTVYRKIIIAFEILFTLAIVIVMALNMPFYATLVAYPFIIFLFVTYAIGQHKMTALLNGASLSKSSSAKDTSPENMGSSSKTLQHADSSKHVTTTSANTDRYKQMLRLIRNTSRGVVFCGFIVLVFGALYAILAFNWKNYAPVGTISIVTISNDIFVFGIVGTCAIVQWYIWRVLGARVRRLTGGEASSSEQLNTAQNDNSFTNTGSFNVNMRQVGSFSDPKRFQEKAASFHTDYRDESQDSTDDGYV
ncbi:Hypothetical Protein FCC1311_002272 [Hondaea fermentalgiana]|uniref:Uncharacterized protein n=1 Tax=Hondaea fermentalgiana TaxID=2315210 RepID=A0A2R5G135_9STRA|nr:Hypothetical Protein FCC1311_002272 [Hondaea fermentalgiana]|eukprot:GBG24009.1 Hypothetical Protein FCC1311_002272 [Hondaea fermentalgiana]